MKKHILFFIMVFIMSLVIAFVFGKKSIVGKAIVKVGVDLSAKKPEAVPLQELEDRIVCAMRTYDYGNFSKDEIDSLDRIVNIIMKEDMDSAKFMSLLIKADQYFDTTDYSKKESEDK